MKKKRKGVLELGSDDSTTNSSSYSHAFSEKEREEGKKSKKTQGHETRKEHFIKENKRRGESLSLCDVILDYDPDDNRFPIFALGPKGTYSHQAAVTLVEDMHSVDPDFSKVFYVKLCPSFDDIHDELRKGNESRRKKRKFVLFPYYNTTTGVIPEPRIRETKLYAMRVSTYVVPITVDHYAYLFYKTPEGSQAHLPFDMSNSSSMITKPFVLRIHPAVQKQCKTLVHKLQGNPFCQGTEIVQSSIYAVKQIAQNGPGAFGDECDTITLGPYVETLPEGMIRSEGPIQDKTENVTSFGVYSTNKRLNRRNERRRNPTIDRSTRVKSASDAREYLCYLMSRMNT